MDNLQACCHACHRKKTVREEAERLRRAHESRACAGAPAARVHALRADREPLLQPSLPAARGRRARGRAGRPRGCGAERAHLGARDEHSLAHVHVTASEQLGHRVARRLVAPRAPPARRSKCRAKAASPTGGAPNVCSSRTSPPSRSMRAVRHTPTPPPSDHPITMGGVSRQRRRSASSSQKRCARAEDAAVHAPVLEPVAEAHVDVVDHVARSASPRGRRRAGRGRSRLQRARSWRSADLPDASRAWPVAVPRDGTFFCSGDSGNKHTHARPQVAMQTSSIFLVLAALALPVAAQSTSPPAWEYALAIGSGVLSSPS